VSRSFKTIDVTVPDAVNVSALFPPVSVSIAAVAAALTAASTTGVVVVVSVVVSVVVVVVLEEPPQAASDRAISDTPPARAAFAFFFSQTAANFSATVGCLLEASIPRRGSGGQVVPRLKPNLCKPP